MLIPVDVEGGARAGPEAGAEASAWSRLAAADKRERLLLAAAAVFTRRGIDAPMSEVAEAAGAGVASVYRIFASKEELLAALVVRRWEAIEAAALAAGARPGSRWEALTDMLRAVAAGQSAHDFLVEARAALEQHPDVGPVRARAWTALERLLHDARTEGRLRPDASTRDVRLLLAATRAARRIDPDSWRRMLDLMIDALDRRPDPEES